MSRSAREEPRRGLSPIQNPGYVQSAVVSSGTRGGYATRALLPCHVVYDGNHGTRLSAVDPRLADCAVGPQSKYRRGDKGYDEQDIRNLAREEVFVRVSSIGSSRHSTRRGMLDWTPTATVSAVRMRRDTLASNARTVRSSAHGTDGTNVESSRSPVSLTTVIGHSNRGIQIGYGSRRSRWSSSAATTASSSIR